MCVFIPSYPYVLSLLHGWNSACKPGFVIVRLPQIDLDAYHVCLFRNPIIGSLLYNSLSLVFGAQDLYSGGKRVELAVHRSRGVLGRPHASAGFEKAALPN